MQKTTKFLILLIFVEIMFTSIGYAAIGNCTFNISGTLNVIDFISPNLDQSVFYYAGYFPTTIIDRTWTPGTEAKNGIVLHYDGILKTLNGNGLSRDGSSTWSDLSGHGNHGSIVKGALKTNGQVEIENLSETKNTVNWKFVKGPTDTSRTAGTYSWGENFLNLDKNSRSFVLCNSNNEILPVGQNDYTMEIYFDYSGTSEAKSGLLGTGIYRSATSLNDSDLIDGRLERAYNKAKIWHIINWYCFNKYQIYPYEQFPSADDRGAFDNPNYKPTINPENSGKANAIRINDSGNGIYQYYWDNDINTDDDNFKLTKGRHTVTTKYTGGTTYIYIDGKEVSKKNSSPNTSFTYDYNHNRPNPSDTKPSGTKAEIYSKQPLTVGATNLKVNTTLVDVSTYRSGLCHVFWTKNHCFGEIEFSLDYQEYFDGNIYSVRVYNRALSETEIQRNAMIDEGRFGK